MENTTLHFTQLVDMNSHYIWSALNNLVSLGEKYNEKIEYHSTHDTSSEYYDIYVKCPSGIIAELVVFYILCHLPELKYKGEDITK